MDGVGVARFVTKLDLYGYWQVPLTEQTQEISAFVFSTQSLEIVFCHDPSGTGEDGSLATSSLVLCCMQSQKDISTMENLKRGVH